jgi:hypothetical protein
MITGQGSVSVQAPVVPVDYYPSTSVNPSKYAKKPKSKLFFVFVTLIVLVGGVFVTFVFFKNKSSSDDAELINLKVIFDETAPIPVKLDSGEYGYISPKDGSVLIEAQYVYAERFYGEYAIIAVNDRRGSKFGVIDRGGKVILESSSRDSSSIQYIVGQNIWKVDNAFYDGKMEKITADDDEAQYINYGYIMVKRFGEEYYSRILNRDGKEIFRCASVPCAMEIAPDFNNNKEFYVVVQYEDRSSVLVSLQNGREIMRLGAETSQYFSADGNNLFSVKRAGDGAVQRQFLLYGGEIRKEFDADVSIGVLAGHNVIIVSHNEDDGGELRYEYYDVDEDSMYKNMEDGWDGFKVYPFSDFTVVYCKDEGWYGLKGKSSMVLPCEYDRIIAPPKNVFKYYSLDKKQDLFILFGGDVRLFDAKKKATLKIFEDSNIIEDVRFFEDSSFYVVNNSKIYSFGKPDGGGVNITDQSVVEYFGNYFVVDGTTVYGLDLSILNGKSQP